MEGVQLSRIECPIKAESLARTANIFGSWDEYRKHAPKRVWVRGPHGWRSFDPVIQRQIERKAAKEARDKEQKMSTAMTAFSVQLALVSGA